MLEVNAETVVPQIAKAPVKPVAVTESLSSQSEKDTGKPVEATLEKEIRKPTLWEEIKSTGKVIINQAITEVRRQIDESGGDKGKIDAILSDKTNSVLFTIDQMRALKPGQAASFKNVDQQVNITDTSGWVNTVVGLQSVDGKSFYAVVVDANNKVPHLLNDSEGKPSVVSLKDLEQAHLLQKLAPQLGSLPESQGKIISLYLESVKTGKELASLPDNAEKMLLEAATSAGILTTKDVEILLNRVLAEQKPGPDATATEIVKMKEDNEKSANKRARLLKPFTDQGIVLTEPKQVIDLLNGLGVGSAQLSEVRNQVALEYTRLKLQIESNRNKIGKEIDFNGKKVKLDKEMMRQWEEDMTKAGDFSEASLEIIETFKKDGPIKQYFDELNAGTLSQETGQKVVEAFQTGKITEPPDVKTVADTKSKAKLETMHKAWKKQDTWQKVGKGSLIAGGSLFGILGAFAFLGARKKE